MSWPTAFVVLNGNLRKAIIWGVYASGTDQMINGEVTSVPEVAVSIYYPLGNKLIDDEYHPRYRSVILPISDVRSVNWECIKHFKEYDIHWWTKHGVKCFINGYGAHIKQEDLDRQLKEK